MEYFFFSSTLKDLTAQGTLAAQRGNWRTDTRFWRAVLRRLALGSANADPPITFSSTLLIGKMQRYRATFCHWGPAKRRDLRKGPTCIQTKIRTTPPFRWYAFPCDCWEWASAPDDTGLVRPSPEHAFRRREAAEAEPGKCRGRRDQGTVRGGALRRGSSLRGERPRTL